MNRFFFRFPIFVLVLTLTASAFAFPLFSSGAITASKNGTVASKPITVVLDAGHGGEDGGAVSANGVLEKDLNLSIALRLRALLEANGIRVVLTRSTDTLLYDKDVDYHGRKKALDLAARKNIAESTENCVFVSIHMNAFPIAKYQGLQVWYSKNHPASLTLAQSVQSMNQSLLQPSNERPVKAATSSIYLLHHLRSPAILVECGFLSNPEEATLLASEEYQENLAFLLFLSLSDGIEKISSEFSFSS